MRIVRSSASFPAEVWHVSNMFPGKSFARRDSRCYQIQLVDGGFKFRSLVVL